MVTYYDEYTLTGGTTKDTFGTATTFNLNSKARKIFSIIASGCDTVYTTAEGGVGDTLRVNSSSLSIADQRFLTGPWNSSGPVTNSSGQGMVPDILPVDWNAKGNEAITIDTAPGRTITTGHSTMVSFGYYDVPPPPQWLTEYPIPMAVRGGYTVDAAQLTTTRTALTAINIPSWANYALAVRCVDLKAGAITTGQAEQTVFELTSTIPDITPMKLPSNSEGATLGTPVGTAMYNDWIPWIPIFIQLPGGTQTITPFVNLVSAVTTGNQVLFGVNWW